MRIAYSEAQEELRRELRGYFEKRGMTPQRRAALTSSDGEIGEGDAYRDVVRQMGLTAGSPWAGPRSSVGPIDQ